MSRFESNWSSLNKVDLEKELTQGQIVWQVKKGNVSSVYAMIVKTADESWGKLPPHTRQWYTKEEYIAAGVAYTVTKVAKEYKRTRDVKFSTYLQTCLINFYNTLESEPLRAEKRWEGGTISFDSSYIKFNHKGTTRLTSVEFYVSHTAKKLSPDEEIINRLDAKKHFLSVYDAATPNLRKYLIRWFLTSKIIRICEGQDYRSAKKELRNLAAIHGFTCQMALFLAGSDLTRAECALQILKTYRTSKSTKTKDQYSPNRIDKNTLEFDLKPTAEMASVL